MNYLSKKKSRILDALKMTSSFIMSSVILINCYCYILNSTFKTNKNKDKIEENNTPKIEAMALNDSYPINNDSKSDIKAWHPEFAKIVAKNLVLNSPQIEEEIKRSHLVKLFIEAYLDSLNPYNKNNEEKIKWILDQYNLTEEEFKVVVAVTIAEAKGLSYEDAYAVINVIYNRTICSRWINEIKRQTGEDAGTSLYEQVIAKGQFTVYYYGERTYRYYLDIDIEEYPGYQAVIDFLYGTFTQDEVTGEYTWNGPERLHDLLNFVGHHVTPKYSSQSFTSMGNNYGIHITDSEYVTDNFTSITEQEIEKRAQEVEEFSNYYRQNINKGMAKKDAINLARTKLNK